MKKAKKVSEIAIAAFPQSRLEASVSLRGQWGTIHSVKCSLHIGRCSIKTAIEPTPNLESGASELTRCELGALKIIPDERLNSLKVVSHHRCSLRSGFA